MTLVTLTLEPVKSTVGDMSNRAVTYAEVKEGISPLAWQLEQIARRLRQGAISEELAASKLITISEDLIRKDWTK